MTEPYSESKFIELITNFKPPETVSDPEEAIKAHREIFDFMEKLPATVAFVYDFFNFRYILATKSFRTVMGISEDIILKGGFQEALEYFHPDDKNNIGLIHKEMFGFMFKQPAEDLKKFRFDFNYRFLNSKKEYKKILQQTVITTVLDGKPLYDLSTCTDITIQKKNNRLELNIYKRNEDGAFELVLEYVVPETIGFGISISEFKVLKMVAEGLSSQAIADKLFRSIHTINIHRRSLLAKTKSATLTEALLKVDL